MHLRRTFIDDLEGPTLGKIKQIMMVVLRHAEKYGHIPIGATELGKADRRRHHAEHVEHNPGCFSWPLVLRCPAPYLALMNSQMPREMTDAIPNARQRTIVRNSNPKPRRVATNKKADNVANIAPHTPVAISRVVFRIIANSSSATFGLGRSRDLFHAN